jgi:hypothetical protein
VDGVKGAKIGESWRVLELRGDNTQKLERVGDHSSLPRVGRVSPRKSGEKLKRRSFYETEKSTKTAGNAGPNLQ